TYEQMGCGSFHINGLFLSGYLDFSSRLNIRV
ncbi:hypothetical protein, partial [Plasmodium yoelii yoelii]